MLEPHPLKVDKRQLRRGFETAARTYDAVAVLQHEIGRRLLNRLDLVKLDPKRILDVGAGTGRACKALGEKYRPARVVALDIALSMLQHTRAQCGRFRRPALVCADAEDLPIGANCVDLIYSNAMLQWCNDLAHTFAEFHRVMAPGGLLMFTTFGPDTLKELRQSWTVADGYTHVNVFVDMHDVGDALVGAGFADPVMDMEIITLTYRDLGKLMQELKLLGAGNNTLARPRGLTGKQRLQRVYAAYEQFRTPEGILPATYEVVYGHAWKQEFPSSTAQAGSEVQIPVGTLKGR